MAFNIFVTSMPYIRCVMAIVKFSKRPFSLFLVAACFMVFGGIVFANRSAIAKQLDNWLLLPRNQGVTELYFVDDKQLPAAVKIDSLQKVAFAIHNLEHEATTYRYTFVVTEAGAPSGQTVGGGSVRLEHDELQTVSETIKIPTVNSPRAVISVELEYQGIPFGKKVLDAQHTAIQYWVNVVGVRT